MNNPESGWFVIYTKPRHEKKIALQLEEIHIMNYLPRVKTLKAWSDRRKYIEEPLFPSYIFVHLEDTQAYFRSLEIAGVLHYVRTGREIARVDENIIRNLQLIISHAPASLEVCADYLCPGIRLCIKEGPFTGFSCEVIQYKGKQKILVRIELLQRNIIVDMPVEALMPAMPEHCN